MSDIYQRIHSIFFGKPYEQQGQALLGLLYGDDCVTPEDRCAALTWLCQHQQEQIGSLRRTIDRHGRRIDQIIATTNAIVDD